MKAKLLLVDDDDEIRTQMRWSLAADYEVATASDRSSAIEAFRAHQPAVVLLDLGLPPNPGTPEEGLAALSEILAIDALTKVVIVSGQGEKEVALRAVGSGAYDILNKPVDLDELRMLLKRAFHVAQLEREYRQIQQRLQVDSFEGMLGSAARMQTVFTAIRKVATTDAPVLILGESGTGKEMTARAIHERSPRKNGPFVAINCSAIPEALIESELFGHEKGAFTGAHAQRKGRIEMAAGGTLFLDELGEIPLLLQVKLLRFLQDQKIERVGGRQEIAVDVRIIAATNADLKKSMAAGTFREDLFYRLAVVQILLPALREREDDVLVLAHDFLRRFAAESGKEGITFATDAIKAIRQHDWPGNVRELQNRVRRAVIMGGKKVTAEDLELTVGRGGTNGSGLREARENLERDLIRQSLRKHGGKISAAATDLGISRPTLYEMMEKLGIQRPE
jgi:two-component system, NtrC family, response regulator